MQIEVLYFEACPNYLKAIANLKEALARRGDVLSTEITMTELKTEQEAGDRAFLGSPTFLVDDKDLFGVPDDPTYGLRCRIFILKDRVTGIPSADDFVSVLDKISH